MPTALNLKPLVVVKPTERFITREEAYRLTLLSPSSQLRRPDFPKPIKLGPGYNGRIGLLLSEVRAWMRSQVAMRDGDLEMARTKPFAR